MIHSICCQTEPPGLFLKVYSPVSHPSVCTHIQSCTVPNEELALGLVKLDVGGAFTGLQFLKISQQEPSTLEEINSSSHFSAIHLLNLLIIPSSHTSKSFLKTLKRIGPKMKPSRTPLFSGCQPDVTPFSIQYLISQQLRQLRQPTSSFYPYITDMRPSHSH